MLTPGGALGGRYQLTQRIATGGMGDVWKAEDTVLGRTVAVKALQPAMLEEPGFAERFRAEARVMATLNHPGVVSVYDYGESPLPGGGNIAYLVMQFVEGETLAKVLSNVGRLTPDRALDLIAQAADALQAAHERGIIHRDVKPGNLLVKPDGKLALTDFGIARSALTGQLTQAGSVLGTAAYVSPEQASGSQVTPASDVYSLGVVAYQMLSGRRPFEGDNPLEVAMKHVRDNPPPLPQDIPPHARNLVDRAMAKDPSSRWPSAAAMADAARGKGDSGATRVVPPMVSPGTPGGTSILPAAAPGRPGQGEFSRGAAQVPTSGPPADDYTYGGGPYDRGGHDRGGYDQQPQRKSRAGLFLGIAVTFFALALLGAGGYLLLNKTGDGDPQGGGAPTTGPPAATSKAPENDGTATIDKDKFVGLNKTEARNKLMELGFEDKDIRERPKEKRGAEPGEVVDISPTGEVSTKKRVTLYVQPNKRDDGGDDGPFPSKPKTPTPSEPDDDDTTPPPGGEPTLTPSVFQPRPDTPRLPSTTVTGRTGGTHETMRDL